MATNAQSGTSTPFSATTTLSAPPTPKLKASPANDLQSIAESGAITASTLVEYIASRTASSSSVFVYDLAEQAGFGSLTKSWADAGSETAPVVSLQTRAGAGLSLVGRLSQGTSKDAAKGAVLTAYTTPSGLAAMVQSLTYLPPATPTSRLVIQVPTVRPVGEQFALSPTLAPFTPALALLPEGFTVLLSATPQEAVDLAALSYQLTDTHVIHLFDHHGSARETGHVATPPIVLPEPGLSLEEGLKKAGISAFEYAGDQDAQTVVVLLNGPLALTAKALASRVSGLGVVIVRVLRPWDEQALRAVLPASVKKVHVFDEVPTETTQGALYLDVFAALLNPLERGPVVKAHRVVPARTQEFLTNPTSFLTFVTDLLPSPVPIPSLAAPDLKKLLFFSTPEGALSALPRMVETVFLPHKALSSRLLTDYDVLSKPGGVTADRIVLSSKQNDAPFVPLSAVLPISLRSDGVADFVAILDPVLLKSHDVLSHAAPGKPVLVVTDAKAAELAASLPAEVTELIRERNLHLCTLDARNVVSELAKGNAHVLKVLENVVVLLAFLRLYLGQAATEDLVAKVARADLGDSIQGVDLTALVHRSWTSLVEIDLSAPPTDQPASTPLKRFEFNAIAVETAAGDTVVNGARLGSWHDAAKHILFPSAFTPPGLASASPSEQNPALRPELPERTFLITTTVNRRLTPLEYDRNVFHLEFDTRGTGLRYEIGEALGVHGWNDAGEVAAFCAWYGVDPDRLVTLPVPGTDGARVHTRTVFQALQQQVDLFGKPTKTFYTELAEYATDMADQYALRFIGSPEGVATFKKLSEKDTVTFADILLRYGSARPGIEVLCELIGDVKPRHYSIASSQSVVGDRVDLLVVSVDWVTPSGSPRYGQCTRYLSGLKVGQKVTVSIKPSVMKLPPSNTQPIIMAGLGTGAAPFRAFLQHRAHLAAQGIPVGPTYYYFGARHASQEYLYGEEIEAFIADGTIARAGLAFSRDGPRKVYIQHRMREHGPDLARMLWDEQAVFYLCGPTWPVPDVYEALVDSLVGHAGVGREEAGAFLEGLKEEERYVLEVY
ncbi:assimilatory sulfite reductase [Trametes versicolor FP-101664 SS1]|uniref:assimilatory sulfite reductase n=1 Tax=Trametes versicolor (strain FP-101664) TaxID=717944 RepID=UPI00046240DC|nr:assimilatory sulfite reductase [Trametes versicolor FP-101664 SS1]EIW61476.1 assimilatory sulfite reductase [Trametes versicolor FP-101664 SS1]